jgi:hypothetical protein
MLYCDSRCSQTLTSLSLALPAAVQCNAIRCLGDRQSIILRQRVRGSIRAVRAVRNTRVIQTESRVVADVETRSITASKCISELLDHSFQVLLETCSITASKCISKLALSRHPSASLSYLITASQCFFKLARSQPPSSSLSST